MTESSALKPLERSATLVEKVVSQIQDLVLAGDFPPGHRLPSERELGQSFGVSRTVVREALSALIAKGLIEPSTGGGFAISTPSSQMVAQSLTLFLRAGEPHLDYEKIHEVRLLLEVEIAGLAAKRRTEADLDALDQCIRTMRSGAKQKDIQVFVESDVEFHAVLAKASHNPLLWLVMETIADIMRDVRIVGSKVPGVFSRALKHHAAILEAVQKTDETRARSAMADHLGESYRTFSEGMKKLRQEDQL